MEDRRRAEDKHWEKIDDFISESRAFRAALKVETENQSITLVELRDKVKTQNGRIGKLEINDAKISGALAIIVIGMPVILFLLNRLFK